jgi:hypothetical protein
MDFNKIYYIILIGLFSCSASDKSDFLTEKVYIAQCLDNPQPVIKEKDTTWVNSFWIKDDHNKTRFIRTHSYTKIYNNDTILAFYTNTNWDGDKPIMHFKVLDTLNNGYAIWNLEKRIYWIPNTIYLNKGGFYKTILY